MSNLKETLQSAWNKVCDFFENTEHSRAVFHLSHDERDALKEHYTVTQQFTVYASRYGMTGGLIPTNDYRITNLDETELDERELAIFESKLNTMRLNNSKPEQDFNFKA